MSTQVSTPIRPDRLELLHREMPWITLSPSAEVPQAGTALRSREQQRLLQDLVECERTLRMAETLIRRLEGSGAPEVHLREVRNGWRKFFLGHYAFFYAFALLAHVYRQCTDSLKRGRSPMPEVEQACALWRLAGALMLYGVDFSPTETIYQGYIRPQMPEAFSGTWLREYALLSERRRGLDQVLGQKSATDAESVRCIRSSLSESQKCYHTFHFQVMLACVPDMTSKLQEYQAEHGKLTPGERHFGIYDEWFHVVRLPGIDLSSYVRSVCAVFSEVLADLVGGTFLEPEPLTHLIRGVSTALEILRASLHEDLTTDGVTG